MLTEAQKDRAYNLFKEVQSALNARLEQIDSCAQAVPHRWQKQPPGAGGGTSLVIRGEVIEKSGVNCSQVKGDRYPRLESEHRDKPFYATGVSTICHPRNPHAPIGHMNVRMLEVGDKFWFGGGADLTPFIVYEEDRADFHVCLQQVCEKFEKGAYQKFARWCDEYFFIKHRNAPRGVGGVFFDYLHGDFEQLLAFVRDIAYAYFEIYPQLLLRRKDLPYSEEQRDEQLRWRGRYVEFNLVYDRGTHFGLQSGGDVEAILVSLPPLVKW